MATSSFGAYFDIEGSSSRDNKPVAGPPPAVKKPVSRAPTSIELDEIQFGKRYSGPEPDRSGSWTEPPTPKIPKTPNELEMSRPPTPKEDGAASIMQSWNNPPMNKWRLLACCTVYFGNGLNDSAPGALIPYMEADYHIGYAIVSLIFVTMAAGFITAAFFVDPILSRLGRAKSLMLSEVVNICAYTAIVCTPPFGVVVAAYFFLGLATAMNLALNNVFCANLHPSTIVLGAAHGSYGIGGTIGPIIATSLVSHGAVWSRFFFLALGIRVVCFFFNGWSFWNIEKEAPTQLMTALQQTASRQAAMEQNEPTKVQLLKQALRNRTTIMGALFIFAYQGAEVSISGWVISFLINYRGGDPAKVGYVTAGFWAGITLGRFTLVHAAHKVGEKLFVYGLTLGAIAFQLLVWLVPNVIGDAVAVGILGLLLGPVYPAGQTIFTRLLPRNIQTTAIGFIASAGSSGGAVAPLLTGLLAQAVGTYVLHPVCIGMFVLMLLCWFFLPAVSKRRE